MIEFGFQPGDLPPVGGGLAQLVEKKHMKTIRNIAGKAMQAIGAAVAVASSAASAFAQTDIGTTLSTVNGYWTTAEGLGIGILLFVIGRKVVRKV